MLAVERSLSPLLNSGALHRERKRPLHSEALHRERKRPLSEASLYDPQPGRDLLGADATNERRRTRIDSHDLHRLQRIGPRPSVDDRLLSATPLEELGGEKMVRHDG